MLDMKIKKRSWFIFISYYLLSLSLTSKHFDFVTYRHKIKVSTLIQKAQNNFVFIILKAFIPTLLYFT